MKVKLELMEVITLQSINRKPIPYGKPSLQYINWLENLKSHGLINDLGYEMTLSEAQKLGGSVSVIGMGGTVILRQWTITETGKQVLRESLPITWLT